MTARDVLAAIEQRADAATPGPWEPSNANEREYFPLWMVTNDEFHNPTGGDDAPWIALEVRVGTKEDAEFIAHARTDVPTLVAALRAVLDLHGEVDAPWCDCLSSHCKCGHIWPCIDLAEVSETITDALNGVTAGTDQ